jgi:chaperonin GroEL
MDNKKLSFGQDSRERISVGVNKLARAVKATLGPRGRNVVIGTQGKEPHSTKDGVTVAKAISLSDPEENVGAQLVKSVASKTADVAGDGTTTATVLAEAILTQGNKLVAANHDPMSLKRGIDKAVERVVASIKEQSREVSGIDDIRKVATVSANGDAEIGNMIAEAMEKVGNDGVITLEEGKSFESSLKVSDGFEWDRGYLSPFFLNQEDSLLDKPRAVHRDAYVWIINGKLSTAQDIQDMLPTCNMVRNANKALVVIAEDITGVVLNTLAANHVRGVLASVAIKSPGYGESRTQMIEDLAIITGATVRDPSLLTDDGDGNGLITNVSLDELGRCERIEVTKDKTVIIGPPNREDAIKMQCDKIRRQLKDVDSAWDREQMEKRLAKLSGGVATIEVGAPTEVAMKEKRDRMEDALAATRAAIAEGVIPGGGTTLAKASMALVGFSTGNAEEDHGVSIVRKAICEPLQTIARNAGEGEQVVLQKVLESSETGFGFNAATLRYENMLEAGIIDPAKVARVALQNAADVAGLMLTTEALITDEPSTKADEPVVPGMY